MILLTHWPSQFKAYKTKKPKMTSGVFGRTWDYDVKILNEVEVKFWLDYSYGFWYYFYWEGIWYKVSIDNFPETYKARFTAVVKEKRKNNGARNN